MKVLFKLLMQFMVSITNFFLYPVNQAISSAFPDFNDLINRFDSILGYLFRSNKLSYFFNILPPITKNVVLFYLGLLIAFYSISFIVHGIIKVIEIIKNVKIW